jgi:hypothetical protein
VKQVHKRYVKYWVVVPFEHGLDEDPKKDIDFMRRSIADGIGMGRTRGVPITVRDEDITVSVDKVFGEEILTKDID